MSFDYLQEYIINPDEKRRAKHTFYQVSDDIIKNVSNEINIPRELESFYHQIGSGYMFDTEDSYSIDRFLDPDSFMKINLRRDYYEFDPTLELFEGEEYKNRLIFFEVNEGNYLLIDNEDNNGKNAIYYFDEKIANSLEEFLIRFDREGHYFE